MYLVTWQLSEFGNQTPPRGTFGHLTAWHIINIERCHQLAFDWQNRALQGRLWRTKGTEMMTTTTTAVMTTTKNCRPRTGTEVCCVIIIFFPPFVFNVFAAIFFQCLTFASRRLSERPEMISRDWLILNCKLPILGMCIMNIYMTMTSPSTGPPLMV